MSDIEAKLAFLHRLESYPLGTNALDCIETHMSWVFMTDTSVYKLKKPVVFPFLDFSTLTARAFYCREEVRLNARLAPGVYQGVVALQRVSDTFELVPESKVRIAADTVDWLVHMRRLPLHLALDQCIRVNSVSAAQMDALLAALGAFYRCSPPIPVSGETYSTRFHSTLEASRRILIMPQFHLHGASQVLQRMEATLAQGDDLLRMRALHQCILDGHGDLRPEHIFLADHPVVIDCIEFNPQLRHVDPFDEIAFLGLECEVAGAPWIASYLRASLERALHQHPPASLHSLYKAHRAILRARFAIGHLLDPQPRAPERWKPLAERYIAQASAAIDAFSLAMRGS